MEGRVVIRVCLDDGVRCTDVRTWWRSGEGCS